MVPTKATSPAGSRRSAPRKSRFYTSRSKPALYAMQALCFGFLSQAQTSRVVGRNTTSPRNVGMLAHKSPPPRSQAWLSLSVYGIWALAVRSVPPRLTNAVTALFSVRVEAHQPCSPARLWTDIASIALKHVSNRTRKQPFRRHAIDL